MRYINSILVTLWVIGTSFAQPCLPNGITITTQEQIDNFANTYPGCTQIEGNVLIEGATPTSITNLAGLSQITSIDGDLNISNNPILQSLNGLHNLSALGGSLTIWYCGSLPSLGILQKLTTVGGNVMIVNIPLLVNFYGLHNLTSVGGNFTIASATSASAMTVKNLSGLDNLTSVGGNLSLQNIPSLQNLNGLGNLTNVGGIFSVANNGALASLDGLYGGLAGSISVNGLNIAANNALQNLDGLEKIKTIGGNLSISADGNLISLSGLDNLTSVNGDLTITSNFKLTSLRSLTNLTAINGELTIMTDIGLTSLEGLDNIDPTTISNLVIRSSAKLEMCHVKSICDYLAIPTNPATISSNATDCASRGQVVDACAASAVDPDPNLVTVRVYPNPVGSTLQLSGIEEGKVWLVDQLGKTVREFSNPNAGMDMAQVPSGVYFVHILSKNRLLTQKIVKE